MGGGCHGVMCRGVLMGFILADLVWEGWVGVWGGVGCEGERYRGEWGMGACVGFGGICGCVDV